MNHTPDNWDDDSPAGSGTGSPFRSGPPPIPPADGGGGGMPSFGGLNPNAPSFSFNANAATFVPFFNAPPPGMSPAHQPVMMSHHRGPPPMFHPPPAAGPGMFQQYPSQPPPPVASHPHMIASSATPIHMNGPPVLDSGSLPAPAPAPAAAPASAPSALEEVAYVQPETHSTETPPAADSPAADSPAADSPAADSPVAVMNGVDAAAAESESESSSSAAISPSADTANKEVASAIALEPESWEEEGSGSGAQSENAEDEDEDEAARAARLEKKKAKARKKSEGPRVDHLNVIFIGHVDAGKSTIGGHIMFLTGMVDKRTLEKYEREAKEKNRETWYLSWALDTNQEERDKGKTVECGRAFFQTEKKHFTILDAPGHKSFVPNMIAGTAQADVAVLVISARRGEFETGFERGGQTKEHTMLAKTAGVNKLVVLINKMDDPTVEWDQARYEEVKDQITPFLKKCGFNPKKDVQFLPCSGLSGAFLKDPPGPKFCNWYNGPCLLEYLDNLPPVERMGADKPLRMPIIDRYRDMGTLVMGKLEAGRVEKGDTILMMPNKASVEVMQVWADEEEVDSAMAGDNVKLKLKNIEEEDVSPGFVLCDPKQPCKVGKRFLAQVRILEYKSIICSGFKAIMHINAAAEEVEIRSLHSTLDPKTGEKSKARPRFIKQGNIADVEFEISGGVICVEAFKDFPQMGRFTLRDEGKTIAMGKVLKVAKHTEVE